MNTIQFLKTRNINWLPVILEHTERNPKHFNSDINNKILGIIPDYSQFSNVNMVRRSMKYYIDHKKRIMEQVNMLGLKLVLGIDTRKYQIIDVDDDCMLAESKIQELLKTNPYYLSTSKKLPKIFCEINMPPESNHNHVLYRDENNTLLEVQNGQWSYIDPHAKIENADNDIPLVELESLPSNVPSQPQRTRKIRNTKISSNDPPPPKEDFEFCLNLLNVETRLVERLQWLKVGYVIKYYFDDENGYSLWEKVSKKSLKHSKDSWSLSSENRRTWNNLNPVFLTYYDLKKWAEEDDESAFRQRFPRPSLLLASYAQTKKEFEKTNFKLLNPAGYATMFTDQIRIVKRAAFCDTYGNKYYVENVTDEERVVEKKRHRFISKWLNDTDIKTIHSLKFNPNKPKEFMAHGYIHYNLFDGLYIHKLMLDYCQESDSHRGLDLFMECMFDVCGREDHVFEYVLNWIAHLFQKPHEQTHVAILFKSIEGIGKNTVFEFIGKLIGYSFLTSKIDELCGRFNNSVKGKIFIMLNEASGKDSYKYVEQVKTLITEKTITVEQKGIDVYDIDSFLNLVIFSNNLSPIVISPTDRRFVCVEGYYKVQPPTFFTELYSYLNLDTDVGKACGIDVGKFFLERDISGFSASRDRPKTSLYQSIRQTPLILNFLKYFIENKIALNEVQEEYQIQPRILYENHFINFCTQNNFEKCNSDRFYKQIREYTKEPESENDKFVTCHRTNKSRFFVFAVKDFVQFMIKHEYLEEEDAISLLRQQSNPEITPSLYEQVDTVPL